MNDESTILKGRIIIIIISVESELFLYRIMFHMWDKKSGFLCLKKIKN